jgi:hypothetical protein
VLIPSMEEYEQAQKKIVQLPPTNAGALPAVGQG